MPGVTNSQSAEAEQAEEAAQQGSQADRLRSESEPETAPTEAQLQAWATLLQQALATGRQLSKLLQLELKLAVADGLRLLFVRLAMVPVAVLAWLGLSVLLAWLVFLASGSVSLSLAGFVLVQLIALLLLWRAARVFQSSLGLPATRRQLRAMTGTENSDEKKTTDP
ncbi:hypothetical protein Q6D67_11230 [Haliea sp. E1-2-M8]|uniref:hypothetical protein n=1 Tax=Haliea sp. E1-2-M8 TaxID=3064706 RepID=UPI0027157EBC|nr:hypothetical protein [Haliea sp. E1-2-M8]MDO8862276.1 hypothetical protein [Haliea sp. E1-2-M8]